LRFPDVYSSYSFFSYFHIFIVLAVTLILEQATVLLSSGSSQNSALHQAQSQYIKYGLSNAAVQFPAAFQEYSDTDFIRFILKNRLPAK
jgi:hypothetical protein